MPQIITRQDINELFSQANPSLSEEMDVNHDTEFIWPIDIALGGNRIIPLRPGLQLWLESLTPQNPLELRATYLASDPFGLIFVLAGGFQSTLTHSAQILRFEPRAGASILGYGGSEQGALSYSAGQTVQIIQIVVETWLMRQFVECNLVSLPAALRLILQGDLSQAYIHVGETSPVMQMALHQIWHCPYQGLTRKMYLEGKAIELLALKLHQVDSSQPRRLPKALQPEDIERIHQAKAVLLRDIENPPSLMALAKAVGLNDYKLKQGFRHVFGTTVFGCLHDHRMEKARQLLQTSNLTVSEVAYAVGFSNRSYFAAAFKRKFSINPKAYLVQSQRERRL